DLIEPLIYRFAVNDIAGLFVEGGEIASARKSQHLATPPTAVNDQAVSSTPVPLADTSPSPARHGGHALAPRSIDQTLKTLLWAVAFLLFVRVAGHGLQLAANQRTAVLGSRIESDVIQSTFRHVLRLPLAFFSRRSSGALAKQINQLDQVSPIVSAAAHELAPELLRIVAVLVIMFTQSWRLSLVALLLLPPYVWIVRRSVARLETGLDGYYEMWERVSARIQDALGAIKTVKLSGAAARETALLGSHANSAYERYLARNRLANGYLFWQTTLNYSSQALVLGYGGFLILERQLTPGDVVMFVAYLDKLFAPIESLSATAVTLQEHLASLRRALKLIASGQEEPGGVELADGPGRVEFRNVRFSHVRGREVLRGISLVIPAGKVTALVGPSGAGKTTATDLLLRLYEPDSGTIWLDDQPIAAIEPGALRAAIGVVAADGVLFRGTLADNIRYKRPDAADSEVAAAAIAAGLGALIERLPQGLLSEVGERGTGLSVGERQRLQIARILVGRPRILVLDEATANLDYATESDIRMALLDAPDRPTTLVIAHRYSMVRDADYVCVLQGGVITASGTPAELIETNDWFSRFAQSGAEPAGSKGRRRSAPPQSAGSPV
ncbi:MAG: ABC transporter ATP-binding protein, partial [Steroidobacteraceae bacterium]